jgi:hypothetical protein
MWEPLQRYRALDPEAQRIFWRAATLLLLVRVSLRLRGYNETHASLQKRLGGDVPATNNQISIREQAQKICRMVRAAGRYAPGKFTCLEESLALWYLLRKQGISPCLRIGVRKTNGKFEAHAWVELGSEALNQPEDLHRHYAAFEKEFSELPQEPS